MTKPTQKFIEEVARTNRFLGATIEHVYWMKNILKAMQETPLSKDFALMGGSAIAFLYGNIYRLSVDLDLDYIANPGLGREGSHEIEELQKYVHAEAINIATSCDDITNGDKWQFVAGNGNLIYVKYNIWEITNLIMCLYHSVSTKTKSKPLSLVLTRRIFRKAKKESICIMHLELDKTQIISV